VLLRRFRAFGQSLSRPAVLMFLKEALHSEGFLVADAMQFETMYRRIGAR
jgi:hypothetical protein